MRFSAAVKWSLVVNCSDYFSLSGITNAVNYHRKKLLDKPNRWVSFVWFSVYTDLKDQRDWIGKRVWKEWHSWSVIVANTLSVGARRACAFLARHCEQRITLCTSKLWDGRAMTDFLGMMGTGEMFK